MNNISNTLCWAWHFLLLVESNELSLQPFANPKKKGKKNISGAGMFCLILPVSSWYFLWAHFTLVEVRYWHCFCAAQYFFSCFMTRGVIPVCTKVPFSSYLTCVVNNTRNPGNKCLVQMKFAAQLLLRKIILEWWKGINFEIWTSICRKSFFPFISHLSLRKASECFMGLNGTLYFAEWAALYRGAISTGWFCG